MPDQILAQQEAAFAAKRLISLLRQRVTKQLGLSSNRPLPPFVYKLSFADLISVSDGADSCLAPITATHPFSEQVELLKIIQGLLSQTVTRFQTLFRQLLACPACDVTDCVAGMRYFTPCRVDEQLLAAMLDELQPDEESQTPPGSYVTLDQMAAIVNRSKRSLERLKSRKKNPLPDPDCEGGGGRPDEWLWSKVRPWLEKEYSKQLPEDYPAHRH